MTTPKTYKTHTKRVNDTLKAAADAFDAALTAADNARRHARRALYAAADAHIADPTPANAGKIRTARRRLAAAEKRHTAIDDLRSAYWRTRGICRDADDKVTA